MTERSLEMVDSLRTLLTVRDSAFGCVDLGSPAGDRVLAGTWVDADLGAVVGDPEVGVFDVDGDDEACFTTVLPAILDAHARYWGIPVLNRDQGEFEVFVEMVALLCDQFVSPAARRRFGIITRERDAFSCARTRWLKLVFRGAVYRPLAGD